MCVFAKDRIPHECGVRPPRTVEAQVLQEQKTCRAADDLSKTLPVHVSGLSKPGLSQPLQIMNFYINGAAVVISLHINQAVCETFMSA